MNDEIMHPQELRRALAALWWTPTTLSSALDCTARTVRRWLDGSYTVPHDVATWLRGLVALHTEHPAPTGWRGQSVAAGPVLCKKCDQPEHKHTGQHQFR